MPGKLLYRDASGRDQTVAVSGEVFIGRAADCAIRTDDAMVSRKNCRIANQGGKYTVEDLGSSNGTFVNEQRIQRHQLNHSDVIRCGSLQVRFVDEVAQAPPPQASFGGGGSQTASSSTGPSASNMGGGGGQGGLDQMRLLAMKEQELVQLTAERDSLQSRLRDARDELERLSSRDDADNNELRRLRTEVQTLRDRLSAMSRDTSQHDSELQAASRVANELRQEMMELQREHDRLKAHVDESNEEVQARGRLLERAQDDVQRQKQASEELRNKMMELQRLKDESWRELNSRVGEIEHLRQVISEQERILEERRIGLIALEEGVKDTRVEKEKLLREFNSLKGERDELRETVTRLKTYTETLEEDRRRMQRTLQDGTSLDQEERVRLEGELRDQRHEINRLGTEISRLGSELDKTRREKEELEDRSSKIDTDHETLRNRAKAAEKERDDAIAKANASSETQRAAETKADKLVNEKSAALEARDAAFETVSQLKRELETSRRSAGESTSSRLRELEEEVDNLRSRLRKQGNSNELGEIKKRAEDAYYGINDALSELRTNILLARDLAGKSSPDMHALGEAVTIAVDRAEDAKGLLRSLREVVDT